MKNIRFFTLDIKLYRENRTGRIVCVTSCDKSTDFSKFRCTPKINIPGTPKYVPCKSNSLYYILAHSGVELTAGQQNYINHLRRFYIQFNKEGIPCNQLTSTITLKQIQKIEDELNRLANTNETFRTHPTKDYSL